MEHIVDNINKFDLRIKTLDLAGRVPGPDSIELLRVELHYDGEYGPLFMARVRYARDGVEQENGFPIDLHKGAFVATVAMQEAGLEEELQKIGPEIARIVYENLAAQQRVLRSGAKITEIVEASATGDYIYRGEPERYKKVSSSLYRIRPNTEGILFDIADFQKDILKEARAYLGEIGKSGGKSDIEILTKLQHFGAATNLIDFTENPLIALFFACDGSPDKEGRVILLKRESDDYAIRDPWEEINRVEFQKSIFVESPTGFVEPDIEVPIPAELKKLILDYLREKESISLETIYKDLDGFIRRSTYREHLKGLASQRNAKEAKDSKEKVKHHENAIRHYTEALTLNPDSAKAYNNRSISYRSKKDFDAAIQDCNKAIELNPKFVEAYTNRGLAYFDKREVNKAIQDYNKVIELDLDYAIAYNNRGIAYVEVDEFDKAIQDFSKAIDLKPDYAAAYNNRGNAYLQKGDLDTAIQDYSKAIELNPEYAIAYANLGEAWLHLREWKNAKADLRAAKNMGIDIGASFHNDYGSVADFEAKHGMQVPEDIKALLSRD